MSISGNRRVLGTCAFAGPVIFTAAWVVAWPLQDQYSARREDISALAAFNAQYPWIMMLGFISLSLGTIALGLGLIGAVPGRSGRAGSVLVLLAGVGLGIAGLARNDCSSELAACKASEEAGNVSWHHQVHDLVSLVIFLALIAASFVLARSFGQDPQWRDLRPYSLLSGVVTLALLVLYVMGPIDGWNGLVQRIFLAVPWIWIAVLGLRLRGLAPLRARA
jgi:hypothetical membrane protein